MPSSNLRNRAAIVGCGGISRQHASGVRGVPSVDLVALADVYEPNLRAAGDAYGVQRLYLDACEMLASERPDIVLVCTQAPQHAPITIAAAKAGVKGVLCEKPIALTLADADEMIRACERSGTRLAINHQTRMIPTTYAVERALRDGAIGDLRAVRMLDKGWRPAGVSLMEMLTHLFDLVCLYAGTPAWVSAHLTVGRAAPGRPAEPQRLATIEDIAFSQAAWPHDRDCGLVLGDRCAATFGFGPSRGRHDGLTATLESYFQPRRSETTGETWLPSFELLGTDGVMFLGGTSDHLDAYLHRGPWSPPGRLEAIGAPAESLTPPPGAGGEINAPFHAAMIEELVVSIEQGRDHRSSGYDGRWATEMAMGIYESHRRGGARVPLPLEARSHPLERWLRAEQRALPPRPDVPVRELRVPQPG